MKKIKWVENFILWLMASAIAILAGASVKAELPAPCPGDSKDAGRVLLGAPARSETGAYAVTRETAGRQSEFDRTELLRSRRNTVSLRNLQTVYLLAGAMLSGFLSRTEELFLLVGDRRIWKDRYIICFMHDLDGKKKVCPAAAVS